MVRDFDIPSSYLAWLPDAVLHYLLVVGLLSVFGLVLAFFVIAVRYGPMRSGDVIFRVMASVWRDLLGFSPRRVFALARLAVQESMRRKVWVALVIFGAVLLFAGWFLNPSSSDPNKLNNFDPGKLYINFVLTATTYLVMLLAIFLSAMSLPTDLKNRTIYTIVTKPVRTGEIVLGRILGFVAIGTLLLVVMGAASYIFVNRTLSHTHTLTAADLTDLRADPGAINSGGKEGYTSIDHNHRHHVVLDADGNGVTDVQQGHFHRIHGEKGPDGKMHYIVGPPEEQLVARVPIYGSLKILDRNGHEGQGINIGKEWTYRKYLDGGTPMAAIWTFTNITPDRFPNGKLPLEMLLRVFRTYKGEIADEKKNNRTVGILGSIELRNPEQPSMKSNAIIFQVKDQVIDKHYIPRKLERNTDQGIKTVDVFDDLVTKEDGQHRLEACAEMPFAVAIYRNRRRGRVFEIERRLVSAQFHQGLFRHLDADGVGGRVRRDAEHVFERAGRDSDHARHPDHGIFHQERGRFVHRRDRAQLQARARRRAGRIANPAHHATQYHLRIGADIRRLDGAILRQDSDVVHAGDCRGNSEFQRLQQCAIRGRRFRHPDDAHPATSHARLRFFDRPVYRRPYFLENERNSQVSTKLEARNPRFEMLRFERSQIENNPKSKIANPKSQIPPWAKLKHFGGKSATSWPFSCSWCRCTF